MTILSQNRLMIQTPALDPTVNVPLQDLPLQTLQSLSDTFGETMAKCFEHLEERRFAAQNTCTITRPLTPEDLVDPAEIRDEPEPIHHRRIVNDRGDVVSLEKGYFSGHPEPVKFAPGRHRGKPKEKTVFEEDAPCCREKKSRYQRFTSWLERQLKKVGLAYDE